MIKKLDLDIESIVKQSFLEAKKKHGLIVEQDETKKRYVKKPFDRSSDMPKVELNTNEWKDPKTPSAQHLDVVLEGLISRNGTATERYKQTIKNISDVLGMKISEEGVPVTIDDQFDKGSNVKDLLSALQVKDIIRTIIFQHEAQAAGKMFEGLVARILGGTAKFDELNPIQDIETGDEYISLKLVAGISKTVKGSKYNLAKGIARKGKITYLILIKSSENDPFAVRAYSFDITKENYFNFISGRTTSQINDRTILEDALKIVKRDQLELKLGGSQGIANTLSGQEMEKNPKRYKSEYIPLGDLSADEINNAVLRFAKENNEQFAAEVEALNNKLLNKKVKAGQEPKEISFSDLEKQISRENLKTKISDALQQIHSSDTLTDTNKEDTLAIQGYIKNHFPLLDKTSEEYVFNMFPLSTSGAKSFMTSYPEKFKQELGKLNSLEPLQRYYLLEPNSTYKGILEKRYKFLETAKEGDEQTDLSANEIRILNILTDEGHKAIYDKRFSILYDLVRDIYTIFDKIRNYALTGSKKQSEQGKARASAQAVVPSTSQSKIIDAFFEIIKSDPSNQFKLTGKGAETQFEVPAGVMFEIAKTLNSNYDESYPMFYIQKDWIMKSSRKNAQLLDEILVPFFEGVHDIRSGLEQYFTYDEPEGLSETGKGLDRTSDVLEKHIAKFSTKSGGVMKASEINPQVASQATQPPQTVAENKNKPLTKDWSVLMLEELLK